MRQRFAAQQILAEGPRTYLEPDVLEAVTGLSLAAAEAGGAGYQSVRIPVGPALMDEHGVPAQMELVARADTFSQYLSPFGVYSQQGIEDLLKNAPRRQANIEFGWGNHRYKQSPFLLQQAEGFNYAGALREAMVRAVDQLGLRPGDILSNIPLRESTNDYRRPIAYMNRGGFGPLSDGRQIAYVGNSGQGVPALIQEADDGFMNYMKWQKSKEISGKTMESDDLDYGYTDYDYEQAVPLYQLETKDAIGRVLGQVENMAEARESFGFNRDPEIEGLRNAVLEIEREQPMALEALRAMHRFRPNASFESDSYTHAPAEAARASEIIQAVKDGRIDTGRGERLLRGMRQDYDAAAAMDVPF